MKPFDCVAVFMGILLYITPGNAEAGERTAVVCLSKSDHVTFTLAFPETCTSKKLVILDHVGREVLQWTSPCVTDVHQDYRDRVQLSCDTATCQLQLTLLRLTEADSGQLQCRDGGLSGPVLPDCLLELDVIGVEDLSKVCSYFANNRTVVCKKVTQEVKIYRIGEVSDRDISYFSRPFSYTLIGREYGRFSVTRTDQSRESKLCSQDFTFHVKKHTGPSADETSDEGHIVGVGVILGVFLVVFIVRIDVIYKAIFRRRWRHGV